MNRNHHPGELPLRSFSMEPTAPLQSRKDDSPPLLGADAARIIKCNQKLQALGIGNTIKLPQICVIGDQSTGKSSLIEAISTIKVPKAEQTCTQCPIAINLTSGKSKNSPWECTISIEERFRYNPALAGKNPTKARPFGAWEEMEAIKTYKCATTKDKDEVCDLIKSAQLAILNPGKPYDHYFRNDELPKTASVKFSPNVIRLDVSHGSYVDLSFIDLPGVIATTGKTQDKWLVTLVENLASHYAADESGIIMLTIPLTHDAENSKAYSIIQDKDAQSRTLAVYTKPDAATMERCRRCITQLDGENDEFDLGYHVVMLKPGDQDSESNAEDEEAEYFASRPWNEVSGSVKERLGVNALSEHLRQVLFRMTADSLPSNLEAIRARLRQVEAELMTMPPPQNADQLPQELALDLRTLDREMNRLFAQEGSITGKTTPRNAFNALASSFRNEVASAKPTLLLKTATETRALDKAATEKAKKEVGTEADPVGIFSGDDETIEIKTPAKKIGPFPKPIHDPTHRFRLEEVREINMKYKQTTHPNLIEPKAIEEMEKLAVQHWHRLLSNFMHRASKLISTEIITCIDKTFGKHKHLAIYAKIIDWVKMCLDEYLSKQWTHLEMVCDVEQKYPLALDGVTLKTKEKTYLTRRVSRRKDIRIEVYRATFDLKDTKGKPKAPSDEELGDDEYDIEVRMSAMTSAYYDVACSRFTDTVVQHIHAYVLPFCQERLVTGLENYLGIFNYDSTKRHEIIRLMTEDPERQELRLRLEEERKSLFEGHKYITDVLGGDGFDIVNAAETETNNTDVDMTDDSQTIFDTPVRSDKRKADGGNDNYEQPETPASKRQRKQTHITNMVEEPDDAIEWTPSRFRRRLLN